MLKEWIMSDKYVESLTLTEENGIVEISEENAARVFALVRCDPSYSKSYDKTIPSSSSYLLCHDFKMEKECILSIVKAINTENSTHLSDKDAEVIAKNITSIEDFDGHLQVGDDYSIISEIYDKAEKCKKTHMSFSSKFCHFYCWHRIGPETAETYPIIDTVMQEAIPVYDYLYSEKKETFDEYKKRSMLWKYRYYSPKEIKKLCRNKEQGIDGIVVYYSEYVKALKNIHQQTDISVTAIEQLLWYYYNGRELPSQDIIECYKRLRVNKQ